MASLGKRLKISNEFDRISNLPDSILCSILSFIDTKESVQTSILSKRWKFLWTNVPSFDFHQPSIKDHDNTERFKKFVTMALLLHKCQSLSKFRLVCECGDDLFNVSAWLSTAIARNVQVLDINVVSNEKNNFVALPGSLFTCKSLEFLKLEGDLLVRTPSLVFLPRLECLRLKNVRFECDKSVKELIQGCPVLKSLHIRRTRYDNVVVFTVSSPTLRHLEIEALFLDYPEGVKRKLDIDAPVLEHLHLADYVSNYGFVQSLTFLPELRLYDESPFDESDPDLLYYSPLIDELHLYDGLKFLTVGHSTVLSPFSVVKFPSVTKLTVNTWDWYMEDLLELLESSVHLEVLELKECVDLTDDETGDLTDDETWENHVPGCLSSSLRRISITKLSGAKAMLALIKYFLKHGGVLKRVELHPCTKIDVSKKYEIVKKISTFRRKSEECEVHFLD